MNDACLDDRAVPHRIHRFGKALEAVADHHAHICGAAVLDLGQHRQPELGALAAVAGPQAQDVALPGASDPNRHVDRPIGDLAVADLDVDGVDEHHRVHRLHRAVAPLGHLADHLVGDPADGVLRHRRPIDVGEVRGDLTGSQSLCG